MPRKIVKATAKKPKVIKKNQDDQDNDLVEVENLDRPVGKAARRVVVMQKPPDYPKF